MSLTNSLLTLALGAGTSLAALPAQAFAVNPGDVLTIASGTGSYDANGQLAAVTGGSWFALDANGDYVLASHEKTLLSQGTTGLVIGAVTLPGASHAGLPLATDSNAITAPWAYLGNTGSDFTVVGVTGSTTAGLDLSGWRVAWNGAPATNVGSAAWGAGFSNGAGNFVWDGVYGHGYTLDYHATVIGDDFSLGVPYALHLEGTVQAVPEASTWGMMLAGLGLVGFVARRRAEPSRACRFTHRSTHPSKRKPA